MEVGLRVCTVDRSVPPVLSLSLVKALPGGFLLDLSWCCQAETVVLFGPSGAGKSMTFRLLSGLATPDSGEIILGGEILYSHDQRINRPAQQRKVGYLFQHYALFPHMTAAQNILYGHPAPRSPTAQAELQALLSQFQLEPVAGARPDTLSGGQRQRVALARALMRKPAWLLLDEPLSAVDLAVRRSIRSELKRLQRHLNIPMILITHDLGEAFAMADRLIIYEQGRVVQCGAPEEILSNPASPIISEWAGLRHPAQAPVFSF